MILMKLNGTQRPGSMSAVDGGRMTLGGVIAGPMAGAKVQTNRICLRFCHDRRTEVSLRVCNVLPRDFVLIRIE
jgi:hypothetical protein